MQGKAFCGSGTASRARHPPLLDRLGHGAAGKADALSCIVAAVPLAGGRLAPKKL